MLSLMTAEKQTEETIKNQPSHWKQPIVNVNFTFGGHLRKIKAQQLETGELIKKKQMANLKLLRRNKKLLFGPDTICSPKKGLVSILRTSFVLQKAEKLLATRLMGKLFKEISKNTKTFISHSKLTMGILISTFGDVITKK